MASLLEQLEAGDAADDEERAADARFARMLQRMKEGGDGAEREASLQSEIDALSAAEASVEATKIRLRRFCSTALGTSVFADPEELVSRAVTDVAHLRGACVAEKGQYELAEATARLSESTERNRDLEERLAAAEAALRREEQAHRKDRLEARRNARGLRAAAAAAAAAVTAGRNEGGGRGATATGSSSAEEKAGRPSTCGLRSDPPSHRPWMPSHRRLTATLLLLLTLSLATAESPSSSWIELPHPPHPTERLPLLLALRHRHGGPEALAALVATLSDPTHPHYGRYLAAGDLARYLTPRAHASAVVSWLESHGASTRLATSGDFVHANMTVAQAATAFGVERFGGSSTAANGSAFRAFTHSAVLDHRIIRAPYGTALPSHIAPYVELIRGLDDFPPTSRRRSRGRLSSP